MINNDKYIKRMEVDKMSDIIVGYARVSTKDQNLDLQIEAIKKYAEKKGKQCRIFKEKESGGKENRKELREALEFLNAGDEFVVYKIDRLARSTKQLATLIDDIHDKQAEFVSLSDRDMDTTTAGGKMLFSIMGAVAEFEREMIRERTKAGLEAARAKGNVGGRPTVDERTRRQIVALKQSGERAVDIAKEYGIARSTVYKVLKEAD